MFGALSLVPGGSFAVRHWLAVLALLLLQLCRSTNLLDRAAGLCHGGDLGGKHQLEYDHGPDT